MRISLSKNLAAVFLAVFVFVLFVTPAEAQRREHLTAEEIELVRDVQEVDLRMNIFIKAIERRMWVLKGVDQLDGDQQKRVKKDREKWGELPAGSNSELFSDIEGILNEAIDKFEDVFEREPESELLPFALYTLSDYSKQLIPRLQALAENTEDNRELSLLERAARHCTDIISATDQIPRPKGKRPKPKRRTR